MQNIASMTAADVISDTVLDEVFSEEDEIQKAKLLLTLEDRAVELGVKPKFRAMVAAYKPRTYDEFCSCLNSSISHRIRFP